jgi:hypothetical protein
MRTLIASVVWGVVLTAGCASGGECRAGDGRADSCIAAEEWTTVSTKCQFAFRAPPEVTEVVVQGTDSCVVQYEANGCSYSADYGWYSGPVDQFAEEPGYRVWSEQIDGHSAAIATFGANDPDSFGAAVHFAIVPAGRDVKLTMYARCDSMGSQNIALQVFRTVTFDPQ